MGVYMKVQELFEAEDKKFVSGLKGQAKAAYKLGKVGGTSGKPALSKSAFSKSFGDGEEIWGIYSKGYVEGKSIWQAKDDHEAWQEKRAASLSGRKYHE
jgi:hypothetical protein